MKPNFTPFKCLLLLLFLLPVSTSVAQAIEFAILSFNRIGNLIYLEAVVDEKAGVFLIDTGYNGILLNKDHYSGMPSDLYLQGTNGAGGKLESKRVDVKLDLLQIENIEAQIGDLGELQKSIGIPLHGMIGSTFFEDFELMIDYTNNKLVMIKLDRDGEKMVGLPIINPATDTLALQFKGHLPVIAVNVGEMELALGIDTGATSNLFGSNHWSNLEDFVWGAQELYLRGLGKARRKTKAGMVSRIHLEGIPFQSMRTLFSNIGHINRDLAGPNLDGIIGYEFLHQYTMGFNFRKKEMYLWREEAIEMTTVDYMVDNQSE